MKMEAEIRATQPQAKENHGLLATTRRKERGKEGFCPRTFRGNKPANKPGFQTSGLRTVRE